MKLPVAYDALRTTDKRKVREEYIKQQEGKCYHCNAPLNGEPAEEIKKKPVKKKLYPKGFFKNPVHLHHNHITGMTIGAVHCYCNAVLWEYHGE